MAREQLDVLVIGAGVVGAGAALDAATRGLHVGLLEARDYAAGTSPRSSKLIHGGLRYLEQLEFGLVREALGERSLILNRLTPHLTRPGPFLFPHAIDERVEVRAAAGSHAASRPRRPGGITGEEIFEVLELRVDLNQHACGRLGKVDHRHEGEQAVGLDQVDDRLAFWDKCTR